MTYYQFNLYKTPEQKLELTPILQKETGITMPISIEEDKVSSMKWYDDLYGTMIIFFSGSRPILEVFKDGIELGKKLDTLL